MMLTAARSLRDEFFNEHTIVAYDCCDDVSCIREMKQLYRLPTDAIELFAKASTSTLEIPSNFSARVRMIEFVQLTFTFASRNIDLRERLNICDGVRPSSSRCPLMSQTTIRIGWTGWRRRHCRSCVLYASDRKVQDRYRRDDWRAVCLSQRVALYYARACTSTSRMLIVEPHCCSVVNISVYDADESSYFVIRAYTTLSSTSNY